MRLTVDRPLVPAIVGLAVPAISSFVLQNLYHVNDVFFLGRTGPDATNALGLFMMLSIGNFGFILTLARGTQSLVGRRYGAGRHAGCQLALAQGLRLALLVLVPLGLVEWIFAPAIFTAMGGVGATVTEATVYLRTLLLFLPCLFASPLVEFSMQAMGDTKTPFRLQLVAVAVNTLLNFLLVLPHELHWGGGGPVHLDGLSVLPGWAAGGSPGSLAFGGLGVIGAAVATGISRTISAAAGLLLLVRRDGLTHLARPASYRADGDVAREILRVGLPAGSSTFLFGAVAVVLMRIIAGFGQDAIGAYGVGFRGIESVSFMVVLGFGVATGTVVAHAVGAGRLARARRAAHVGTALCAGAMLLSTAAFLLVPRALAGLFTQDPSIQAMAAGYVTLMAFCQVPQAIEMVYGDAMAGAGSSTLTALVSIPGNVLRIPLALWFTGGLALGLDGVWYAIVASAGLKGLGMAVLFVSGAWEKAMHAGRRMVEKS